MSAIIAVAVFLTLLITAIIHVYWAAGGYWPGTDSRSLAKAVVGTNGIEKMPPNWITGLVSLGIFLAALWPLFWLEWIVLPLPRWSVAAGLIVLTLIFLGRGVAGFVPAIRRANSEEPFASRDRRYFSPLILLIGIGLLYLLIRHWNTI